LPDKAGTKFAQALETWLRPSRLLSVDGDQLQIAVPNRFARDWLLQHHLEPLRAAIKECLGGEPRVDVIVDPRVERSGPEAGPTPARDLSPRGLDPRYTFDTFVVGSANQFAQAACQAVAELPSRAYNPLFLYGGVGLGKTHLLHAIGHQALAHLRGLTVFYLSSERFTNELINAIRYDKTAEFRAKYRTIDLLLIDDIQFISGKERTQEEFFHTFNDLYESRKQIILSSDSPPKELPGIEERLRSRFEWGLIADIQPPDFETRVAILKKKAELEQIKIPDDVAYLIADRIKSNIRELEGSLTRMLAFCSLTGRQMTAELAEEILSDLWGKEEKVITVDLIQRKVAEHYNLRLTDLKARNRTKTIAFPRQVAMYLARQLTHAPLTQIGNAFGGKDHTTVIHAVNRVHSALQEDPKLRKTMDALIQSIKL
jgi:chromosomal replication initiator protein